MTELPTFPDSTVRHGTVSGNYKHFKLGEKPCPECLEAKRAYSHERRKEPKVLASSRVRAKAQQRAYRRVSQMYPRLYSEFYHEECDTLGLDKPTQISVEQSLDRELSMLRVANELAFAMLEEDFNPEEFVRKFWPPRKLT